MGSVVDTRQPVRRIAVALTALAVWAGCPGSTAAAPAQARQIPPVVWEDCPQDALTGLPKDVDPALMRCATYAVPLDHAHPEGGTVPLALMKRSAKDSGKRIGSILTNFGGPGAAGWGAPVFSEYFFSPAVLERFDVVAFDPRGVGRSLPLRCYTSQQQFDAVDAKLMRDPVTEQQLTDEADALRVQGDLCRDNAGPLLAHMSTAVVARDLELLRQAVGDDRLTYFGVSYGTFLGDTYANMFPDKVRAIVNTGNTDPALRSSDGTRYEHDRALNYEDVLGAVLQRCKNAGAPACPFGNGDPRAKFDAIREHLRAHADTAVTTADGTSVTLNSFVNDLYGSLPDSTTYGALAKRWQALHDALPPASGAGSARPHTADTPFTGNNANPAVNCSDMPYPRDVNGLADLAESWEKDAPTFGRPQVFNGLNQCSTWPYTPAPDDDVYHGPWNTYTGSTPILLVNALHDPATPYSYAQNAARELGPATRLLTVDAFGHGSISPAESPCVTGHITTYLLTTAAPDPDTTCTDVTQPFDTRTDTNTTQIG
ncbi:alpha/beta hydrolase [Kitasatospora sp. NBC_01560]|uniref:alpha/beta hydrolase n=1 Tax=Kitasatospora sp. NBC_01560 TaxID=2975965 RepID=UPI00386BCAEE